MEKLEKIEDQSYQKTVHLIDEAKATHRIILLSAIKQKICDTQRSLKSLEVGAAWFCSSKEELEKVESRAAWLNGQLKGYKTIRDYINGKVAQY